MIWRLSTGLASIMLAAPMVHAQSPEPVDEVITQASKIKRPYSDVAGSFSAVDIAPITLQPAQALNEASGINIQQGSGVESLSAIRAPVLTGGAGAGSYLYAVDGISLRAPGFSNVNGFLDMPFVFASRFEVGKGPMPITGGGNAVHGYVNMVSPSDIGRSVKLVAGSDEFYSAKLTTSGGGDDGRYSLGANFIHDGGHREQSGYDSQNLFARAETALGSWDVTAAIFASNLNQETAGFVLGEDAFRDREASAQNANPEAFRDVRSVLGYVSAQREFDDFTLTLQPYARQTDMDFRLHFLPGQALERNAHSSLGLVAQIVGERPLLQWVIGADLSATQGELDEFQDAPTLFSFVQGAHYDYEVRDNRASLFFDTRWAITPSLSADIGARAEYVSYDYDNRIDSGLFGRFLRLDDQRDDYALLLPRLALRYAFSERAQGYVRLTRGGRAPQSTDLYRIQVNQLDNPADVETLDAAEIGLKGKSDAVSWDLAAYIMEKDNFFFRDANGFNVSDGKTRHRGVEGSVNWAVSEQFSIRGALTLARHTYAFDRVVNRQSEVIENGNRIDTAPDIIGNMGVRWRFTPQSYIDVNWVHMGEYFTDAANENQYPGHDLLNLSAGYALSGAQLFLRAENLTDVRYADRADFAFENARFFPGRARSFFIGLETPF